MGYGAQLFDDLLTAHTDTVVANRQRKILRIQVYGDLEVRLLLQELGRTESLESQLVIRIRCVGDELPEEDLLVAVHRVNHQVQQLLHLGLKTEGCQLTILAHQVRLEILSSTAEWGSIDRFQGAKTGFTRANP